MKTIKVGGFEFNGDFSDEIVQLVQYSRQQAWKKIAQANRCAKDKDVQESWMAAAGADESFAIRLCQTYLEMKAE